MLPILTLLYFIHATSKINQATFSQLSLHDNLQHEFSFTKNKTCTFVQILHSSYVIPQVINQILHSTCVISQVINQILHSSCVVPPSNKPDFNNLVYSRMQNLQTQKIIFTVTRYCKSRLIIMTSDPE